MSVSDYRCSAHCSNTLSLPYHLYLFRRIHQNERRGRS